MRGSAPRLQAELREYSFNWYKFKEYLTIDTILHMLLYELVTPTALALLFLAMMMVVVFILDVDEKIRIEQNKKQK